MKNRIRKTDSLAYTTGTFMKSLETFNEKWSEKANQIVKLGPSLIEKINKALESSERSEKMKNGIMHSLSSLGELFSDLDEIYADEYVLMTEIDGLEFPIHPAEKLINQSKKEQKQADELRNITQNLSKTLSFYSKGKNNGELVKSSLNSFQEEYEKYEVMINRSKKLLCTLKKELDKEHNRAKKYSDRF